MLDDPHLFDARAVDLLDLAHQEVERAAFAQQHRELVDGDAVAPLEDVDTHDVAVDRTDARRDEAERTGPVGEPHPTRTWIASFTDTMRTSEDDAECFAEVKRHGNAASRRLRP